MFKLISLLQADKLKVAGELGVFLNNVVLLFRWIIFILTQLFAIVLLFLLHTI